MGSSTKTACPEVLFGSYRTFCTCRDGTDELMTGLEKQEVPVLILSAGLGDLIKEILTYFKVIFVLPQLAMPHPTT
jgi:hypothetical protein